MKHEFINEEYQKLSADILKLSNVLAEGFIESIKDLSANELLNKEVLHSFFDYAGYDKDGKTFQLAQNDRFGILNAFNDILYAKFPNHGNAIVGLDYDTAPTGLTDVFDNLNNIPMLLQFNVNNGIDSFAVGEEMDNVLEAIDFSNKLLEEYLDSTGKQRVATRIYTYGSSFDYHYNKSGAGLRAGINLVSKSAKMSF